MGGETITSLGLTRLDRWYVSVPAVLVKVGNGLVVKKAGSLDDDAAAKPPKTANPSALGWEGVLVQPGNRSKRQHAWDFGRQH